MPRNWQNSTEALERMNDTFGGTDRRQILLVSLDGKRELLSIRNWNVSREEFEWIYSYVQPEKG